MDTALLSGAVVILIVLGIICAGVLVVLLSILLVRAFLTVMSHVLYYIDRIFHR